MLDRWNDALDAIEQTLTDDVNVAELARRALTSEFHFRRVFSALAGMPVSEYVRRRRMTLAAADVVAGDTVVDVAVRYGYGSAESFRRAFVAVRRRRRARNRRAHHCGSCLCAAVAHD